MFVQLTLQERNRTVDTVLSNTVSLRYEPTEVFLPGVNQSTVDKSTEEWLGRIEEKPNYQKWYAGHYHIEKKTDKLQIMFNNDECPGK